MKKKIEEKVLLYNFKDAGQAEAIRALLADMHIQVIMLDKAQDHQKIGYLFGLKGFAENKAVPEDEFDFPYELMMFYDVSRTRLSKLLQAMRDRGIEVPVCKSVVTSFNRFWTIRRVCQAMRKEHLAMQEAKQEQAADAADK